MTPMANFVYLASQSPRRRQLLEQLGVNYELLLPDADEDAEALEALQPSETGLAYVQRVTALKLAAALRRLKCRGLPLAPVLCSDTTVVLGRQILGKPADRQQACDMLSALSGRTHRVMTAVAVATQAQTAQQVVSISRVRFATLSPAQIEFYVASGEPFGKAGAYAIQGLAGAYIAHISGSYSGIMGLPLYETAALLRSAGCMH